MSVITANPSMLSVEGRTRASSKHLRNYQKISQANLDEKAILSYLRSHNLHRTLATFASESHYSQTIEPILKIIEAGASSYQASIQDLCQSIRSQCVGKQNQFDKKWLVVQFYLHIWFCLQSNHLNKSKLSQLKHYINVKGDALSELPELLAYFALPYVDNPMDHPFLKRIFTQEWKEGLKTLIIDLISKKQEYKDQEEWLNIIQDMIEISTQLYTHIPTDQRNTALQNMMERVNLYRYVIDKNIEIKSQKKEIQLKDANIDANELDYTDVPKLKSKIDRLQRQIITNKKLGAGLELAVIYHKIQQQIATLQKFKQDKKYIKKLVYYDVCCFQSQITSKVEFQELKLLQMMSAYFQGRTYIEKFRNLVPELKLIIQQHAKQISLKEISRETIHVCADILRKMTIRQSVYQRIIKEKGCVELILTIFQTLKMYYLKGGSTLYTKSLTSTAHLLTQIAIHRKGRQILSKQTYFESICDFFKQIASKSISQTLQKVLCSSIYLLLVEAEIRSKANRFKIKDILLSRMLDKRNEGYQTIVRYIIQRIEADEPIEDGDSDEDEEKSIEYDENIEIDCEVIWHHREMIRVSELIGVRVEKQGQQLHKGSQSSKTDREKERSKSKRMPKGGEKKYSRDKYDWRGTKSTYVIDKAELKDFRF